MKHSTTLALALTSLLMASSSQAAVSTSVALNSTTGPAGLAAWPVAFTTATSFSPATYATSENNYGGASLFSLGQSWTATSSGTLTDIQIGISGTAPVSFNVALYDAGAVTTFQNTGSATYTPGGNVSANLFSDTSLQTWSGYTLGGANAAILRFSLTGADQVGIVSGNQYIFEISSTTNPSGLIWLRNGVNATDFPTGQAFRQRGSLNGNALRDMNMAVTVVPEPSTVSLLALGTLVGARFLRRKHSSSK